MNIKDYLHLYLGCEVSVPLVHQRKFIISGVQGGWTGTKTPIVSVEDKDKTWTFDCTEIKLVLRPLSDMTEEEEIQLQLKLHPNGYLMDAMANEQRYFSFETTRQLLSKGFDIFNLIDAGLAIDKEKLKTLKEKKV